ncbi:MAG: serine hydrolase domain-containing protein [Gemmatimonadales bacterium]|nr:serine hydrolase domain-containing protein [Gemmatimonadales bacterium]
MIRRLATAIVILTSPLAAQLDTATIDSLVEARRVALGIPGIGLAIVHPLEVIHERGFGTTGHDNAPVTAATPFLIGSLSKPITATVLFQLVDEGRIDPSLPVVTYLPEFRMADSVESARITVHQLLTHRSGIPRKAGLRDIGRDWTLADAVASLASVEPFSAPGTSYQFSNANHLVLGRLLEVVTGEPYATLAEQRVFKTLGLTQSFTALAPAESAGLARGHRFWFGIPAAARAHFNPELLASSNLIMSAHDLGTLIRAHLNLGNVDGLSLLSTASVIDLTSFEANAPYSPGWGWRRVGEHKAIGYSGGLDAYQAEVLLLTSDGIGVVLLANTTWMMHWPEIQLLAADVARLTVGLPPLPPATPGPQLVWWLWRAAALLLIAGWGWGIWRLPRRRRQLLAARSAGVRWPATTLASISINLLIVIAVPLALFHFTGLTIPALLVVQADAGWLLVTGLAVAVVRLVWRS